MTDKFQPFIPSRSEDLEKKLLAELELEKNSKEAPKTAEAEEEKNNQLAPEPTPDIEDKTKPAKEKKKPYMSREEFDEKYSDFANGSTYYDKDGNWIRFIKYLKGKVYFNDSRLPGNKKNRTESVDAFDDLIKDYSLKEPKKPETKKIMTEEEFREKYKPIADFIAGEKYYSQKSGSSMTFDRFQNGRIGVKTDKVGYSHMFFTPEEFDEILKRYSPNKPEPKPKKKPEPISEPGVKTVPITEAERARKADEVIKATQSDVEKAEEEHEGELRDPKKRNEFIQREWSKEEKVIAEEKDRKKEELEMEIERTRKAYAEKDYEVTNRLSRIKQILGKHLSFKKDDEAATQDTYGEYQKALKKYLEFQTTELKESGEMNNAEKIGQMMKYFNQDEKANLYAARTNARATAWEENYGTIPGMVGRGSAKFFNWYRKQSSIAKTAFGVGAALSGAGLLIIGQRAIGGAAAGVGATAYLEGRHRKKQEIKMTEGRENIKKELSGTENAEVKWGILMRSLENEIGEYRDSLRTERIKARNRKLAGLAIGCLLGSGKLQEGLRWLGNTEQVQELIQKSGIKEFASNVGSWFSEKAKAVDEYLSQSEDVPHAGSPVDSSIELKGSHNRIPEYSASEPTLTEPSGETSQTFPQEPRAEVPLEEAPETQAPVQEIPKNIELTIEKGGSFQKSIIRQLVDNGMDKEEAGKTAHKMYMQYLESHPDPTGHNIVHSGAKLELSPDGKSILNFEDSPKSQWTQNVEGDVKLADNAKIPESPAPELSGSEQVAHNYEPGENPRLARAHMDAGNIETTDMPEPLPSDGEVIASTAMGASAGVAGVAGVASLEKVARKKEKAKITDLDEKRKEKAEKIRERKFKKLAEKYDFKIKDNFFGIARKIIQKVSLGSVANWGVMKNVKFSELDKENNPLSVKLTKNIKNLEKDIINFLGKEAKHREGETIKKWLARVAKDSLPENTQSAPEEESAEHKLAA